MMNSSHRSFILTAFLSMILIGGAFQNCSPSDLVFEDLAATSLKKEFEYDYKAKPVHYLENVLMLDAAPNPNMKFKVFVFIGTPSWSGNQGSVHVRVSDPDGNLLCPQETLQLSTGKKLFEVSCTPPFNFSVAQVTLTLQGTSGDFVRTKHYSLD